MEMFPSIAMHDPAWLFEQPDAARMAMDCLLNAIATAEETGSCPTVAVLYVFVWAALMNDGGTVFWGVHSPACS